ncbi:hypothetical protein LPJ59_003830 [Coemansia sp. RSA 2399]|nr:hypothetical protein LPJ59_003830 [Coemansia sp. RSA 2399]
MPLFDEKDEGLVKSFLFNKIEKECDADPGIMADYILVTLQNDMNPPELKQHCKTDLVEFFGDKTNVFVDTLFDSLDKKQYLPSSSSSSSNSNAASKQQHSNSNGAMRTSVEIRGSSARASRAEDTHQRSSTTATSSRRRSRSPNSRYDSHRERRRHSRSPSRERHAREPRTFDPSLLNGPLEPGRLQPPQPQQQQHHQQKQQLFQQQKQKQQQQFPRKNRPCFEYMRKGSCQRGDACTYAHVTAEQAQAMGMRIPQNVFNAAGGGGGGAPMPFGMGHPPQMAPPGFFTPIQPQQQHQGIPPHLQGSFANARPPMNPKNQFQFSNTGVFIINIPDECLDDSTIRGFFGKFGEIRDLKIDFVKHSATVDFVDNNAQTQALSTPEAVFNNRFVRVLKARDYSLPSASGSNGSAADHVQQHGDAAGSNGAGASHAQQQQPPVWRPKSAAIKKAEMIEKYVEQQKELMKKLTTIKDMPAATRKIIMDSINQIQKKIDDIRKPKPETLAAAAPAASESATAAPNADSNASEKQALQSKLQALQQEAARLGMSSKGNAVRPPPWVGGSSAATASVAASAGSSAGAARGSMSLDKRPRTLVLSNVEQPAAERLDAELAQFGEIETISKVEDGAVDPPFTYTVRYKARWEAENALKAVASLEGFGSVSADWGQ